jgi:hypothetical protein
LAGEAQELFSVRHGPVRAARILPAPDISESSSLIIDYFPQTFRLEFIQLLGITFKSLKGM